MLRSHSFHLPGPIILFALLGRIPRYLTCCRIMHVYVGVWNVGAWHGGDAKEGFTCAVLTNGRARYRFGIYTRYPRLNCNAFKI